MEIQNSKAQIPRELPKAKLIEEKTPAQLAAEMLRWAAQRERERRLGDCPEELAAFAAGVCALVYHPFVQVRQSLSAEGATDVRCFDRRGTQAIAFTRGEQDWIVFRGSESFPESEMFIDWGHDLLCVPWGWPPRHLGFALAWAKVRETVLESLRSRTPGRGLVIVGHSLGGALALVAAYEIARAAAARLEAVITFGAPRVGAWPWARAYRQLAADGNEAGPPGRRLADVTWRIHNWGDIVTYVPPLLFSHCGKAVSFSNLHSSTPFPAGLVFPQEQAQGFSGSLKYGYQMAKHSLPYSPLTLLIDLLLATIETAPQHFMRLYAPAFPSRPFRETGEPPRPRAADRSLVDRALLGIKGMILLCLVAGILWVAYVAYRLSPELSTGLLLATILYFVIGYASPKRSG